MQMEPFLLAKLKIFAVITQCNFENAYHFSLKRSLQHQQFAEIIAASADFFSLFN